MSYEPYAASRADRVSDADAMWSPRSGEQPEPGAWLEDWPGAGVYPLVPTGPPWPRQVASGPYTPPRLIRWPIVIAILWIVWNLVINVVAAASTPSTTSSLGTKQRPPALATNGGFRLTAEDAAFSATFPGEPQRSQQTVDHVTLIVYQSDLSYGSFGVSYVPLLPTDTFDLDAAIAGVASALPGGAVVTRARLTYEGSPAEDALIAMTGGVVRVRVVQFGSSAYVFEAEGATESSFVAGYDMLLRSFTHP